MKKLTCSAWLATLLCLTAVQGLEAQRGGIGGVFDWIHKLSGPMFVGGGLNFSYRFGQLETRNDGVQLAVTYRTSIFEAGEVTPAGANIHMLTARGTFEVTVLPIHYGTVDFGFGLGAHRFSGAQFNDFWHFSLPLELVVRPWSRGGGYVRRGVGLGVGWHIFDKFDATDFADLVVSVERDTFEPVFAAWLSVGLFGF